MGLVWDWHHGPIVSSTLTRSTKLMHYFDSTLKIAGRIAQTFPDSVIKNEPMFFSSDLHFVREHKGPVTTAFLNAIPFDWFMDNTVIMDSRVHMLMPGWYPCIPGWHHDDVPRGGLFNQPNYQTPEYKSEHLACIIGDASRTDFAYGKIDLPDPALNEITYEKWHPLVDEAVRKHRLLYISAESGVIYQFDWNTFHKGNAATKNGWRIFLRLSRKTNRPVLNEIRKQTQIYMSAENAGW